MVNGFTQQCASGKGQGQRGTPSGSKSRRDRRPSSLGIGQLSLVEHSLCLADGRESLCEGATHQVSYCFFDRQRKRRQANVRVFCPAGLSPHDEFYLWGLLALTLAEPDTDGQLFATPHFCLRRLGLVDPAARRGGRQYRQFQQVLERLAAVTYQNDAFYDPIRAEHRRVSFGFLSYSLPLDEQSSRAWRIVWNPLLFELARATGGHLRFDLATYRELDIIARRLFLFLSKLFYRRIATPALDLRELAVNVLGLSANSETKHLKQKLLRTVAQLAAIGVVEAGRYTIARRGVGRFAVTLTRGPYFDRDRARLRTEVSQSALFEPLLELGFSAATASALLRRYKHATVREWIDITLAARERFGDVFFKRNAAAYLTDNVKQAAAGTRTPPDWWHELRKAEERRRSRRRSAAADGAAQSDGHPFTANGDDDLLVTLTRHFLAAGQPEPLARANAARCGQLNSLKQKTNP